jgi:hypothetical protein
MQLAVIWRRLTMTIEREYLQQEAAALVDCLAAGHHYASVHLARLIEADTNDALRSFAAELGAQVRTFLQQANKNKKSVDRLAQLDLELYGLMLMAAKNWVEPGYREASVQPEAITCQMVRVNGQACNAPAVKGSRFCRYHLTHDSDW